MLSRSAIRTAARSVVAANAARSINRVVSNHLILNFIERFVDFSQYRVQLSLLLSIQLVSVIQLTWLLINPMLFCFVDFPNQPPQGKRCFGDPSIQSDNIQDQLIPWNNLRRSQ